MPRSPATATAVEYYNPALNHYFITAYPEEAAALDAGTNVKGWMRTGGEFTVLTDPAPDRAAVCRFFGTPGLGLNSHFYTADPAECAKVKTLPAWTFEAIAFYIPLPANGDCPAATQPVYRSYYSRPHLRRQPSVHGGPDGARADDRGAATSWKASSCARRCRDAERRGRHRAPAASRRRWGRPKRSSAR